MSGIAILSEPAMELMADTEERVGPAVQTGVEALVREHSRFVFRLAYSVLRNTDDAEDVTQEVFIRVLKNRDKLADVRDQKLWLAKIAWRVTLDHKRSLDKRRPTADSELFLNELPAKAAGAEQLVADKQMRSLLEKLVAALPADLREPLALSTVQELNSNQIAAVLGIPEGSVRTRLMRARDILKKKMAAAMGETNG